MKGWWNNIENIMVKRKKSTEDYKLYCLTYAYYQYLVHL